VAGAGGRAIVNAGDADEEWAGGEMRPIGRGDRRAVDAGVTPMPLTDWVWRCKGGRATYAMATAVTGTKHAFVAHPDLTRRR
jgi:hypothetical protein